MIKQTETAEKLIKKRGQTSVVNCGEDSGQPEIDVSDIGYPIQSDTRGVARISYLRKSIYFGEFESARSHVLFGLWKAKLEQRGEPVECKSLRPLVKAAIRGKEYVPRKLINSAWFVIAVMAGLLVIAVANYAGYRFYSSYKPVQVDGMVLSQRELALVRTTRKTMDVLGEMSRTDRFEKRLESVRSQIRESQTKQATEGNPNAIQKPPN